jgi:hypothetical protein
MTIAEIVNKKDMSAEEKVSLIYSNVEKAMSAVGVDKDSIEVPLVNTANGLLPLNYLNTENRVALAGEAYQSIVNDAVEAAQEAKAIDPELEESAFDLVFEKGIATNPILVHVESAKKAKY